MINCEKMGAEQENLRADFDTVAEDRYARIVASGKTIPWEEMRGHLEERLAGNVAKRPAARKLARCSVEPRIGNGGGGAQPHDWPPRE